MCFTFANTSISYFYLSFISFRFPVSSSHFEWNTLACLLHASMRRIIYKVATITYRTRNCQQPSYSLDSLISYQPVRTQRSSSYNLLVVPNRVKTVTSSRAFRVAAPTIWNNLPDSVKVADSFNVFKRRLKCHLFNEAF